MLVDRHCFAYRAQIPWSTDLDPGSPFQDVIAQWLCQQVGPRYQAWAWDDSGRVLWLGVAFRWDQDRMMFVLRWA